MKIKRHTLRKFSVILIVMSTLLTAHPALAAVTETELAGNSISDYPYFEYVKAINANDNVEIAIDPTRYPAIAGLICDIYVVAAKTTIQWNADSTLTDVTPGGMQTETFSGTNIQSNTFQVAAANQLSANAGLGLGVGYDVYPKAIEDELGEKVTHRTSQYLNNGLEQDHRGIKQRIRGMRGFKCFPAASRFCTAFDELRNYLRPRERMRQSVSLTVQRALFLERWSGLMTTLKAT